MANSAQARKRAVQNQKQRLHNDSLHSRMRTFVKHVLRAVRDGNQEQARSALQSAESMIDKTASKGIIHRNSESPEQIAEERRLFYVGMTRARFRLQLSFCRSRKRYGETLNPEPSRFLAEIPSELLDWQATGKDADSPAETEDALARLRALLDT